MNTTEAKAVIKKHKWVRGMMTKGHPHRAELKLALNTLAAAGIRPDGPKKKEG